MSPKRSLMRMPNKVTVLEKSYVYNDMGQRTPSWSVISADEMCLVTPSGSSASIRVLPTIEQADYVTVYFLHSANITYGTRLQDFKVRLSEEMVYPGLYEIRQIDRHTSMSGTLQYLQVTAKSVTE